MKKIFFVTNADWTFVSHRLPIALEAMRQGYEVWLLSHDTGKRELIEEKGIRFVEIPFDRKGKNPLYELKCIYKIYRCYKKYKPDVVHHVALKASLYGSIAAKLTGLRNVVNAITGLGYAFTDDRGGLLQIIIKILIRLSFKSRHFAFILQNPDDLSVVKRLHLVSDDRLYLIKGSGVDLNEYSYAAEPNDDMLQILFPARILIDKGVQEFIDAADILKERVRGRAKFVLAGDCDMENPAVLPEEQLKARLVDGYIEWIGYRKNMLEVYCRSHIVALPSYREGLPKSLIEACAVGRPIVTTDAVGCRETVIDGYNGFLVPVKDSEVLAEKIAMLVGDKELRMTMGRNSRAYAEDNFSITTVVNSHLEIYRTLLNR